MLQKMLKLHGSSKLTRNQQMNILGGYPDCNCPPQLYQDNSCDSNCSGNQICVAYFICGNLCGYGCQTQVGDQ